MTRTTAADVPANQLFEFDMYADRRFEKGLHEALKSLHEDAPDIFFTPANDGHWMVTRAELLNEVLTDPARFSAKEQRVPRVEDAMVLIPLNLDPPEHTFYRRILTPHFGPNAIAAMRPKIREWAQRLVAAVADKGECDFAEEVGSLFPVSIFMELMGLPLERLREYRALVLEYFENVPADRRIELENIISNELRVVIEARKAEPKDDLISKLLVEAVEERQISMSELEQLCNLLFQAGMDTVANFASFFFLFLARNPDVQRQICEAPDRIPDFVDEGLRMFGVVSNARLVTQDTELGGAQLREGDIVVCALPLAGLDERRNADPLKFDIDRKGRSHMVFSQGNHLCIGHNLARAEMRVLLEEWVKAIPEFRLAEGFEPPFRPGSVFGLGTLSLEWDVAAA